MHQKYLCPAKLIIAYHHAPRSYAYRLRHSFFHALQTGAALLSGWKTSTESGLDVVADIARLLPAAIPFIGRSIGSEMEVSLQ